MAARRLIIVLVILFAVSIGAAAIAPDREGLFDSDSSSSTTSTTTTTDPDREDEQTADGATGRALTERIAASATDPPTVSARAGDQLELTVTSTRAQLLQVAAFGLDDYAEPAAPARFYFLFRHPGKFPITNADTGATVAKLQVTKPKPAKPEAAKPTK